MPPTRSPRSGPSTRTPSSSRVRDFPSTNNPITHIPILFLAQWINTDRSRPTTYIAYDLKYNRIFLSGDPVQYSKVNYWKPADPVVRLSSPEPRCPIKPTFLMHVPIVPSPSILCPINRVRNLQKTLQILFLKDSLHFTEAVV